MVDDVDRDRDRGERVDVDEAGRYTTVVRFAYYERLSRVEKRAYDESDKRRLVPLRDPGAFRIVLGEIETALKEGDRAATERAVRVFVDGLAKQLDAPDVTVRVLSTRPSDDESELHGFYEMDDDGCRIRVWMRTAAQNKPVAFRSFVRTVLHELCHHLDFAKDALDHSFHTSGFFARESHLTRQLLGPGKRKPKSPRDSGDVPAVPVEEREAPKVAAAAKTKKKRAATKPSSTMSAHRATQETPRPKFLDVVKKPRQQPPQMSLFDDE